MLRAVFLLAACAIPATVQVSSRPAVYTSLQFSHLRMRGDDGTVPGASGSGLTAPRHAAAFTRLSPPH